MDGLILKKGGKIYTRKWVYDDKTDSGVIVIAPIVTNNIFHALQYNIIELEVGYKLRDYFLMIINNPDFIRLDNFFPFFIDEYYQTKTDECICGLTHLCVGRINNIELDTNGKVTEYDNYIEFDGVGSDEKGVVRYAIEFTPLGKLLDVPLIIEPDVTRITTFDKYKIIDEKTYNGMEQGYLNLYDFIRSIIWELSFVGTPEDRDREMNEMNEQMKSIEDGTAELVELDLDTLFDKALPAGSEV